MNGAMWKELKVTPEEQELARQIVEGGAGKSLSEEQLNQYQVEKEWNLEIDTRV